MESEILELLVKYAMARKFADNNFVDEVISIAVRHKNLGDFVTNVIFESEGNNSELQNYAAYSFFSRSVIIKMESLRYVLERGVRFDDMFSEDELYVYKNLIIVQVILHELEHASQHKKIEYDSLSSTKTKLIKSSFQIEEALKNPSNISSILNGKVNPCELLNWLKQVSSLYLKNYDIVPTERMAQIDSYRDTVHIVEPLNKRFATLYEFQQACFLQQLISKYKETMAEFGCPTAMYLSETGQLDVWEDLDFHHKDYGKLVSYVMESYDQMQRFYLGLPVAECEFKELSDLYSRTNKAKWTN